jgi:hypothetical protein
MFAGIDCSVPRCKDMCSFHGRCMKDRTCKCDAGYTGKTCAVKVCPNGCSGHGKCGPKNAASVYQAGKAMTAPKNHAQQKVLLH